MPTTDLYVISVSICGIPYLTSETLSLPALMKVVQFVAEIYDGANWALSIACVRDQRRDPRAKNVVHYYPYEVPRRDERKRTAALIDDDDVDSFLVDLDPDDEADVDDDSDVGYYDADDPKKRFYEGR